MPVSSLSVAERIAFIKNIFMDFGIAVPEKSPLEQAISNEFGRGKKSELNQILEELIQETDAGKLAICIGTALEKSMDAPELQVVGKVLRERIPSLMQIIDIRQQTQKRTYLLTQLLQHFEFKIKEQHAEMGNDPQSAKLLRMLAATLEQIQSTCEIQAGGILVEHSGLLINQKELVRGGKILRHVTPALIALEHKSMPLEQKVNMCINALGAFGRELADPNILKIVRILDLMHNLACISLPEVPERYTIEQALRRLDLSLGHATIQALHTRAIALGLSEKEVVQILYHHKSARVLSSKDQSLLAVTFENKQHAAICGFLTRLGQEIKCKELERIGLAGICLVSLRQTFFEIKTQNITPVNFSESLGLILASLGTMTKNKLVTNIGAGILDGVKAYAGALTLPGGPIVAVPLAICSVLNKVLLTDRPRTSNVQITPEVQLQLLLQQMVIMQNDYRRNFAEVFNALQVQHRELLSYLDRNFTNLCNYIQHNHNKTLLVVQGFENRLDVLQSHISKEFLELYLEHIYDPMHEIQFFLRYQQGENAKLQQNKIKLSMWLLFKSRSHKANGRSKLFDAANDLEITKQLGILLNQSPEPVTILGSLNRFLNVEFGANLPEDLPHIPSWIEAAQCYIDLLNNHPEFFAEVKNEIKVIEDIVGVGELMQNYQRDLIQNARLWRALTIKIEQSNEIALAMLNRFCTPYRFNPLQSLTQIREENLAVIDELVWAQSAPEHEQLEKFEPINLNVTNVWNQYFRQLLSYEISLAEIYNLGKIQITYHLDSAVNHFVNVREAYGLNPLTDQTRYVLFKINMSFLPSETNVPLLLATAWFAYDLQNTCKRFEEYYNLKFKYGLRHKRYLWIALDGMRNQVAGNGETETHKLIDYSRLANIYNNWWLQSLPVNEPNVAAHLRNHPQFIAMTGNMLGNNSCIQVQEHNILISQVQMRLKLQQHLFAQRTNIVALIQDDHVFKQTVQQLEAYVAVWQALQHIFLPRNIQPLISQRLLQLLTKLNLIDNLNVDFMLEFRNLFSQPMDCLGNFDYKNGILYQTLEGVLLQFGLLQVNLTAPAMMRLKA